MVTRHLPSCINVWMVCCLPPLMECLYHPVQCMVIIGTSIHMSREQIYVYFIRLFWPNRRADNSVICLHIIYWCHKWLGTYPANLKKIAWKLRTLFKIPRVHIKKKTKKKKPVCALYAYSIFHNNGHQMKDTPARHMPLGKQLAWMVENIPCKFDEVVV